jgi:hypothetical protein
MADCTSIDNTVRLYAGQCRGGFDFPLLFEESILILLPILLAILIAAATFTSLLRSPVVTASLLLGIVKTVRIPVLSTINKYTNPMMNRLCGHVLQRSTSRWLAYGPLQDQLAPRRLLPQVQ